MHGGINEVNEFVSLSFMLVRHLKSVSENEYLERVKFSIPSFHAYGHNAQCQICVS